MADYYERLYELLDKRLLVIERCLQALKVTGLELDILRAAENGIHWPIRSDEVFKQRFYGLVHRGLICIIDAKQVAYLTDVGKVVLELNNKDK